MPGKGPPALKVIMWGVVLFDLEGAISTSKIISNFLILKFFFLVYQFCFLPSSFFLKNILRIKTLINYNFYFKICFDACL